MRARLSRVARHTPHRRTCAMPLLAHSRTCQSLAARRHRPDVTPARGRAQCEGYFERPWRKSVPKFVSLIDVTAKQVVPGDGCPASGGPPSSARRHSSPAFGRRRRHASIEPMAIEPDPRGRNERWYRYAPGPMALSSARLSWHRGTPREREWGRAGRGRRMPDRDEHGCISQASVRVRRLQTGAESGGGGGTCPKRFQ